MVGTDGSNTYFILTDAQGHLQTDVLTVPAPLSTTGGGTEAAALRVTIASDSTGIVSVDDNGGALTVDNGGTFAMQAASAGDVAHDAADSGNPIKIGMKAVTELPTGVSAADRTDANADKFGRQLVAQAPQDDFVSGVSIDIIGVASTEVIAAPAATYRLAITDFTVTNDHATVGTVVKLTDGSGGTVLWRNNAREDGGGFSKSLKTPLILTAATALHAINETTGASVQVSASGYLTR